MKFQLASITLCVVSCASVPDSRAARDLADLSASTPLGLASDPAPQTSYGYGRTSEVPSYGQPQYDALPRRPDRLEWARGQTVLQGFLGVSEFDTVTIDGGSAAPVDGDGGELDDMPVIGGGAQYKLGGQRIDWGIEGLFSFGGRANATAFAAGGGGAVVAVDVDLLVFDLYGGLFASAFLGDKLRVYAAAGPMLEWAEYEQTEGGIDDDGSGFGSGTYARTGIEFALDSSILIGFGVRWSDSTVDLDDQIGELELEGFQMLFTVTQGF